MHALFASDGSSSPVRPSLSSAIDLEETDSSHGSTSDTTRRTLCSQATQLLPLFATDTGSIEDTYVLEGKLRSFLHAARNDRDAAMESKVYSVFIYLPTPKYVTQTLNLGIT